MREANDLIAQLEQRRHDLGWTAQEVTKRAGVHDSTWVKAKRNRGMNTRTLILLADALGMTVTLVPLEGSPGAVRARHAYVDDGTRNANEHFVRHPQQEVDGG